MSYNFKKIKEAVSMESLLARWNIHPDPGQTDNEWKSYRTDLDGTKHKDPCFGVSLKGNVLRDFRDGETYTVLDIAMKLKGCDVKEAARYLGETFGVEEEHQRPPMAAPTVTVGTMAVFDPSEPLRKKGLVTEPEQKEKPSEPTESPSEPKIKVAGVRSLTQSQQAATYLAGRGIPIEFAKDVCRGVWYQYTNDPKNKKWWGVGFRNRSKAWIIRNNLDSRLSKFQIGSQDITIIEKQGSPFFAVFEGFIDFLSWRVLSATEPDFVKLDYINVIVLNSIVNYKKAFEVLDGRAKQIGLMLDNDKPKEPGKESPGDATTRKFLERYPNVAKDMRFKYSLYKDVNDCLMNCNCPF